MTCERLGDSRKLIANDEQEWQSRFMVSSTTPITFRSQTRSLR